jgi:predicted TPR repeat methyltransferase
VYTVGVSSAAVRKRVCEYVVRKFAPKLVLDLACGSGVYGRDLKAIDPKVELIGIDGCLKYLGSAFCQMCYKVLIKADVWDYFYGIVGTVRPDVILFMDVLEHLEKDAGLAALECLKAKGVPVVMSTPMFEYEQGAVEGNELETHRCWWSQEEIEATGFELLFTEDWDGQGDIGAFRFG